MAWRNRTMWLQCIAAMLEDPETRSSAISSIETATRFVDTSGYEPSELAQRWAETRQLKANESAGGGDVSSGVDTQSGAGLSEWTPKPNATRELTDLHHLYKLIPEIEPGSDERDLSNDMKLLIGVIFGSIAIISLALNVIAVAVLAKYRRGPWKYLVNLSVSDVVGLCSYTVDTYFRYVIDESLLPPFLCWFIPFIVWASDFVAVMTMIAIVRKRKAAILRPLEPMDSLKIWRLRVGKTKEIFIIWLVAIFYSLPQNFIYRNVPICFRDQPTFTCVTEMSPEVFFDSFLGVYYLLSLVLPFFYLCLVYTRIALEFWRRPRPDRGVSGRRASRLKTVKMLLVVVVAFVAFWLPVRMINLIYIFFPKLLSSAEPPVASIQTQISLMILIMLHTCINPIIYCLMGGEFRRNLRVSLLAFERSCSAPATQSELQCSSETPGLSRQQQQQQQTICTPKRQLAKFETLVTSKCMGTITKLAIENSSESGHTGQRSGQETKLNIEI